MQLLAWLAAALVFTSFFMKTIVPLRRLAIGSNVIFIAYALYGIRYGVFDKVLPIFVLHSALLPLNIVRLREVHTAIRRYQTLRQDDQALSMLVPHMTHKAYRSGAVIFSKNDVAEDVFLLQKGRVALPDVGRYLKPGDFFGEVGVFSDSRLRTSTAVCDEDSDVLQISGAKIIELFYQDTRFALIIVRAMSGYLGRSVAASDTR